MCLNASCWCDVWVCVCFISTKKPLAASAHVSHQVHRAVRDGARASRTDAGGQHVFGQDERVACARARAHQSGGRAVRQEHFRGRGFFFPSYFQFFFPHFFLLFFFVKKVSACMLDGEFDEVMCLLSCLASAG